MSDAYRWRTVLLLRTSTDRYPRRPVIGPIAVRDLDNPPPAGVDEDGTPYAGGWFAGVGSRYSGGIVDALADQLPRRFGLRVYVATLTATTVAEWRAALPGVVDRLRDANVGWGNPKTVVLARVRAAAIEADILARWPRIKVVWAGALAEQRPSVVLADLDAL